MGGWDNHFHGGDGGGMKDNEISFQFLKEGEKPEVPVRDAS